jgi:hypothetical protein
MMTRRFLLGVCTAIGMILMVSASSSAVEGRWKLDDSGGCYFDAADSGPDQCDPTLGRWKDDGNGGCYFDSTDSGPDQCVPSSGGGASLLPAPDESLQVATLEAPVGAGRERAPRAEEHHQVAPDRGVAGDDR